MNRPYKLRNRVTGQVRSFASFDGLMNRVVIIGQLPVRYQDEWEYVDPQDGRSYSVLRMAETARTLARIYDVGQQFLAAR